MKTWRVCINYCPFMVQQLEVEHIDMDSFVLYLEQLQTYYCTYTVRFYGLAIRYKNNSFAKNSAGGKEQSSNIQSYLLIFDHHRCTLRHMLENDMIVDGMQIATIALQLMYFATYLHLHEQPRCLGSVTLDSIYWPMAIVLPYMGTSHPTNPLFSSSQQHNLNGGISIQNDIKAIG